MSAVEVVEVALGERAYPVVIGHGWLDALAEHCPLPDSASRVLLVTQQAVVDAGHIEPVEGALERAGLQVDRHLVPDGEAAKSVEVLAELWRAGAQVPMMRGDLVVAVGGGVVTDLGGFVAATLNRGIPVLQIPTTLLGQVDAAVGGKNGINLPEGKNLVGAFHQPVAVACDVATLATLPERIVVEGLAEVVKTGLLADPTILELIEADPAAARAGDPDLLRALVRRSVAVKAAIVAGDERESSARAYLNLGHTYAHALEALTGYGEVLHGEAVAVGTLVDLTLGLRLGRTPPELVERAEALLDVLGLPTRGPALDRDQVWDTMRRDKKAGRDGVRFVVLDGLAAPALITPDPADVDAVLDELTP